MTVKMYIRLADFNTVMSPNIQVLVCLMS